MSMFHRRRTAIITMAIVCQMALCPKFAMPTLAAAPKFMAHVFERDSQLVQDSVMSCTLADLDGDGDLDWTAVRDMDADGDVDIVIKPWNGKDNPRNFVYLENQIIR